MCFSMATQATDLSTPDVACFYNVVITTVFRFYEYKKVQVKDKNSEPVVIQLTMAEITSR